MNIKGAAHTFPLSDFFKKADTPGHAKCILCVKAINYGSKGSHALLAHRQTECHKQRVCNILSTCSISVLQVSVNETPTAGAEVTPAPEKIREKIKMLLPSIDPVTNAEVAVVGQVSVTLFAY